MIIHDCECSKCDMCYDVTEMCTKYFIFHDEEVKEYDSLDEVECPYCGSTEKEVRYFED